jgi:putative membrane protein
LGRTPAAVSRRTVNVWGPTGDGPVQARSKENPMMYWGTGMGGWGMLYITFSTLLVVGLIIGGIMFAVRQAGGRPPAMPPQADPRQILAERYARGEIGDDEYGRRLGTLRGGQPPSAPTPV